MNKKTPHKFQEKMELTYEQYFHALYDGMVQLAREIERVLGRERAFEIIGKAREKAAVESVKKQIAKRGPINNFEDFKAFMKKEQRSNPMSSYTGTATYPEETPKKWVAHATECIIAKTFKDLDATDLGYIMCCHTDFAAARAYHPKIKLRRTKTLMQGDNCCDHTFCWEE